MRERASGDDRAISELLRKRGGGGVSKEVWELVYGELRQIARRQLFHKLRRGSLATTGLVHEAYVKLNSNPRIAERGRAYFFGAAARAMRQILVDHTRRRRRQKRGGDEVPVTLTTACAGSENFSADVLDLDRALEEFELLSPRAGRVVELRFFGGCTVDETAVVLEVSPRTVKSDWALARAWLHRALSVDRAEEE